MVGDRSRHRVVPAIEAAGVVAVVRLPEADIVREVAMTEGRSCREIDMALHAYSTPNHVA